MGTLRWWCYSPTTLLSDLYTNSLWEPDLGVVQMSYLCHDLAVGHWYILFGGCRRVQRDIGGVGGGLASLNYARIGVGREGGLVSGF